MESYQSSSHMFMTVLCDVTLLERSVATRRRCPRSQSTYYDILGAIKDRMLSGSASDKVMKDDCNIMEMVKYITLIKDHLRFLALR